jgi:hypothetical protein
MGVAICTVFGWYCIQILVGDLLSFPVHHSPIILALDAVQSKPLKASVHKLQIMGRTRSRSSGGLGAIKM